MAEKAGFLTKCGGSIKTWKRRWCVLKNGAVHYSKNQKSQDLGIIPLKQAGNIRVSDAWKKKKHCFEVETPNRTYYICAESEADMQAWIDELIRVRDRLQGKVKAVPVNEDKSQPAPPQETKGKVGLADFELLKVIGKGSFGKVLQVRKKDTGKIYAMKVLNKKQIMERGELEHTKSEKNILQKLVHPFLVNLNYSFQTSDKLYFIMDYVNGGELFFSSAEG